MDEIPAEFEGWWRIVEVSEWPSADLDTRSCTEVLRSSPICVQFQKLLAMHILERIVAHGSINLMDESPHLD